MKKALIITLALAAVVFGLFAGAAAAAGMVGGDTLTIHVDSNPSGATATYLSTGESQRTPATFTFHSGTVDWGTGSTIKVEKSGYKTDTSIYISSNEFSGTSTINRFVTLMPVQTDGYVSVSSDRQAQLSESTVHTMEQLRQPFRFLQDATLSLLLRMVTPAGLRLFLLLPAQLQVFMPPFQR